MAEMRAMRGGALRLRSGRYATRSSSTAMRPDMAMAATNIIATQKMTCPTLPPALPPRSMTTHSAAKVPYMKTSECAKLMRRSTP